MTELTPAERLSSDGFVFIRRFAENSESLDAAHRLGYVDAVDGLEPIQPLAPLELHESPPNTYSGNFGRSDFPLTPCRLKIAGLSQLTACGLGVPFKSTSTYDAADYFAPDDQYAGFDDDNNEY
jgi:hypothetical protein